MERRISAILWDIDGTLLNFPAAEEAALHACFEKFGLGECTPEMLKDYSAINLSYWKRIERGEIGKGRALVARYEDFFARYGLPVERAAAFNDEYQVRLGDTVVFEHGAYEAVAVLRGDAMPGEEEKKLVSGPEPVQHIVDMVENLLEVARVGKHLCAVEVGTVLEEAREISRVVHRELEGVYVRVDVVVDADEQCVSFHYIDLTPCDSHDLGLFY